MARLLVIKRSGARVDRVWSVDRAVGTGCPNVKEDVLLVQFLLRALMDDAPGSAGFRPTGQQPIQIDGFYGPQTQAYLKFYEQEDNRRNPGNPVVADGRVDPILSGGAGGSISGLLYKIIAMNMHYKKRRGTLHLDISQDAQYPKELDKSFFVE